MVNVPAAGDYEFKVALGGTWSINYGIDGKQDEPNYQFSLNAASKVSFIYDPKANLAQVIVE